jgi:hypothetical protein
MEEMDNRLQIYFRKNITSTSDSDSFLVDIGA